MHILSMLDVDSKLTPKYYPKISGCGMGYGWGYSKLQYCLNFKDGKVENLRQSVEKGLDRNVLSLNRIRKYSRKAREYKTTYHLLSKFKAEDCSQVCKCDIEHITKVFKVHRSAIGLIILSSSFLSPSLLLL